MLHLLVQSNRIPHTHLFQYHCYVDTSIPYQCVTESVVSISSSFGHHQAKEFGVNKGYVGCTAEKESSVKKGFCKTRLSVCKVGACFLIICEPVIAYVANLTQVNDVVYSPVLLCTTLLINVGQTVQIKQCGEGHSSMCFFLFVLFQITFYEKN